MYYWNKHLYLIQFYRKLQVLGCRGGEITLFNLDKIITEQILVAVFLK